MNADIWTLICLLWKLEWLSEHFKNGSIIVKGDIDKYLRVGWKTGSFFMRIIGVDDVGGEIG